MNMIRERIIFVKKFKFNFRSLKSQFRSLKSQCSTFYVFVGYIVKKQTIFYINYDISIYNEYNLKIYAISLY